MIKDNDRHLVKNVMSKGTIHKAPQNMTDRVWSSLINESEKVRTYQPLIPTWVWMIVGIVVIGVLFMVGTSPDTHSNSLNWQAYLQPITGYLDQSLQNLTLIAFSSLTLLIMVIYFNSLLINSYYKNLSD